MGEQPRYLLVIHACTVRTMEVHTGPRKGVRRRASWYSTRSTTTGLTFLPDVGGKRPRSRRVLLFHFADRACVARGVSAAHVER